MCRAIRLEKCLKLAPLEKVTGPVEDRGGVGTEPIDRQRSRPGDFPNKTQQLRSTNGEAEDPLDDRLDLIEATDAPDGLLFEDLHEVRGSAIDDRFKNRLLRREVIQNCLFPDAELGGQSVERGGGKALGAERAQRSVKDALSGRLSHSLTLTRSSTNW